MLSFLKPNQSLGVDVAEPCPDYLRKSPLPLRVRIVKGAFNLACQSWILKGREDSAGTLLTKFLKLRVALKHLAWMNAQKLCHEMLQTWLPKATPFWADQGLKRSPPLERWATKGYGPTNGVFRRVCALLKSGLFEK